MQKNNNKNIYRNKRKRNENKDKYKMNTKYK